MSQTLIAILLAFIATSVLSVYDRREPRVVKKFEPLHWKYLLGSIWTPYREEIRCVRWSQKGDFLATTGGNTAKVIDFGTGKVIFTNHALKYSNQTFFFI